MKSCKGQSVRVILTFLLLFHLTTISWADEDHSLESEASEPSAKESKSTSNSKSSSSQPVETKTETKTVTKTQTKPVENKKDNDGEGNKSSKNQDSENKNSKETENEKESLAKAAETALGPYRGIGQHVEKTSTVSSNLDSLAANGTELLEQPFRRRRRRRRKHRLRNHLGGDNANPNAPLPLLGDAEHNRDNKSGPSIPFAMNTYPAVEKPEQKLTQQQQEPTLNVESKPYPGAQSLLNSRQGSEPAPEHALTPDEKEEPDFDPKDVEYDEEFDEAGLRKEDYDEFKKSNDKKKEVEEEDVIKESPLAPLKQVIAPLEKIGGPLGGVQSSSSSKKKKSSSVASRALNLDALDLPLFDGLK